MGGVSDTESAFDAKAFTMLAAAGVDTDDYVVIDGPKAETVWLDGHFTADELRKILSVMDELAKERG